MYHFLMIEKTLYKTGLKPESFEPAGADDGEDIVGGRYDGK
jgi:hypothetical protein